MNKQKYLQYMKIYNKNKVNGINNEKENTFLTKIINNNKKKPKKIFPTLSILNLNILKDQQLKFFFNTLKHSNKLFIKIMEKKIYEKSSKNPFFFTNEMIDYLVTIFISNEKTPTNTIPFFDSINNLTKKLKYLQKFNFLILETIYKKKKLIGIDLENFINFLCQILTDVKIDENNENKFVNLFNFLIDNLNEIKITSYDIFIQSLLRFYQNLRFSELNKYFKFIYNVLAELIILIFEKIKDCEGSITEILNVNFQIFFILNRLIENEDEEIKLKIFKINFVDFLTKFTSNIDLNDDNVTTKISLFYSIIKIILHLCKVKNFRKKFKKEKLFDFLLDVNKKIFKIYLLIEITTMTINFKSLTIFKNEKIYENLLYLLYVNVNARVVITFNEEEKEILSKNYLKYKSNIQDLFFDLLKKKNIFNVVEYLNSKKNKTDGNENKTENKTENYTNLLELYEKNKETIKNLKTETQQNFEQKLNNIGEVFETKQNFEKEKNNKLEKEVKNFEKEVKELKEKNNKLEKEVKELKEKNNKLEKEVKEFNFEIKNTKKRKFIEIEINNEIDENKNKKHKK
jgi:hypothetical protein